MNCKSKKERDLDWVEKIRNDDKVAFSSLFETYYLPLCEFAYRYVKQKEVMEDVVQEVFVRIWEKRKKWQPNVSVSAYLYRSVYNQLINDYRKKRFEIVLTEDKQANIQDPVLSPMDQMHYREASKAIKVAIAMLPERRKEIVVLKLIYGFSYKEISTTLGISVNTVDTQVRRARKLLRNQLKHYAVNNGFVKVE